MISRLEMFLSSILLTFFLASHVTADTDLALGKIATQSGTYRGGKEASKAVDGNTGTESCAMVDTSDPGYIGRRDFAWWQVDLEDPYNVSSVTIFSNDWSTLTKFDVYISNGMDVSDAASRYLCVSFEHRLVGDYFNSNETSSFPLNCTRPRVGRFVTVMSTGGNSPTRMTLCEVEVDGYRFYYCDNCASSDRCNNTHGCSQCKSGYTPPSCTTLCSGGFYGTNCGQRCPPCPDSGLACDPITGDCPVCNNCQPNQASNAALDTKTTSVKPVSKGIPTKNGYATIVGTTSSLVLLQFLRFS